MTVCYSFREEAPGEPLRTVGQRGSPGRAPRPPASTADEFHFFVWDKGIEHARSVTSPPTQATTTVWQFSDS